MRVVNRAVERIVPSHEQIVAVVANGQCGGAAVLILLPNINIVVWVSVVDVDLSCNADEQRS